MAAGDLSVQRATEAFAAELARWRVERGLTKKQLAIEMGFDPSYVSHIEGRRHRPTEDFARRAEAVLSADGAIWRRFMEYDEVRRSGRASAATVASDPPVPEQLLPPGTGLVVDQEVAVLSHLDDRYRLAVRRTLYNASAEPVSRYLIHVTVDRFPGEHERSNRYHREHPLRWEDLELRAAARVADGGAEWEPMEWRAKHDRDAYKEVWLLFENANRRFPLYPGHRVTIEYTYLVPAEVSAPCLQRAVRLPTRQLTLRLDLPAALAPAVWGVETSLSAEEVPLRTPIVSHPAHDRLLYEWTADVPSPGARYRLHWRFRAEPASGAPPVAGSGPPVTGSGLSPVGPALRRRVSEQMRAAGIVQRGADVLRQPAQWFRLPRDAPVARDVIARLVAVLGRVGGTALSAPQVGLPWAAAVVCPADTGPEPFVLLNPRVLYASPDTDEAYEACLSFFDQRGIVRRPVEVQVEYASYDGVRAACSYRGPLARLVVHAIDHLEGRLYVDRMMPGVPLEQR